MRKLIWTATVGALSSDWTLVAQCKSSKAELMRRLLADDPVWRRPNVRLCRLPVAKNSSFRRGLSIRCISRVEMMRCAA